VAGRIRSIDREKKQILKQRVRSVLIKGMGKLRRGSDEN
jgi:hypothetical protein